LTKDADKTIVALMKALSGTPRPQAGEPSLP
jgi:hypothetical protein